MDALDRQSLLSMEVIPNRPLEAQSGDVIPFTGHSQRRALLVIRFAVLDLGSCSKDVNWSRRDRLRKTVGSSRASCE